MNYGELENNYRELVDCYNFLVMAVTDNPSKYPKVTGHCLKLMGIDIINIARTQGINVIFDNDNMLKITR